MHQWRPVCKDLISTFSFYLFLFFSSVLDKKKKLKISCDRIEETKVCI